MLPDGRYRASAYLRPCNWVQALEGDIDTIHAPFLHGGASEPEDYPEGTFGYYEKKQRSARFVSVDTSYGAIYGAYRPAGPGYHYWRIGQFLMPFWTEPPPGLLGLKIASTAWVPMDDHHTMVFSVWRLIARRSPTGCPPVFAEKPGLLRPQHQGLVGSVPDGPERSERLSTQPRRPARPDQLPGDSGWARPSGHRGPGLYGAAYDRSGEHLGSSDVMIIRVRRRLLEAARAFAERQSPPPAVDEPEVYGVRAGGTFLPQDVDWLEGIKDLVPAFVDHPELDVAIVGPSFPRPTRAQARTRG